MPNPLRDRVSRRHFLAALLYGGGATAIAVTIPKVLRDGTEVGHPPGTVGVLTPYPRKRVAALSDLAPGKPVDFDYPLAGQKSFVVKLGQPASLGAGPDEDIVAFSYLCTHMGCPLIGQYKDDHKIIGPCPCHYSAFDLRRNGMVTLGQATESLPQIMLAVEDDEIWAVGVLGLVFGFRSNLLDAERAGGAS